MKRISFTEHYVECVICLFGIDIATKNNEQWMKSLVWKTIHMEKETLPEAKKRIKIKRKKKRKLCVVKNQWLNKISVLHLEPYSGERRISSL